MTRVGHGFSGAFGAADRPTGRALRSHMGAPGTHVGIAHLGRFDTGLCLILALAGTRTAPIGIPTGGVVAGLVRAELGMLSRLVGGTACPPPQPPRSPLRAP